MPGPAAEHASLFRHCRYSVEPPVSPVFTLMSSPPDTEVVSPFERAVNIHGNMIHANDTGQMALHRMSLEVLNLLVIKCR
uniref:Uncharacterized protein n=1 Tax=Oryza meridionalis TaxID=40149 RepID=A0A0E0DNC1_9ORYZ